MCQKNSSQFLINNKLGNLSGILWPTREIIGISLKGCFTAMIGDVAIHFWNENFSFRCALIYFKSLFGKLNAEISLLLCFVETVASNLGSNHICYVVKTSRTSEPHSSPSVLKIHMCNTKLHCEVNYLKHKNLGVMLVTFLIVVTK